VSSLGATVFRTRHVKGVLFETIERPPVFSTLFEPRGRPPAVLRLVSSLGATVFRTRHVKGVLFESTERPPVFSTLFEPRGRPPAVLVDNNR
jgi:hypothetical protein